MKHKAPARGRGPDACRAGATSPAFSEAALPVGTEHQEILATQGSLAAMPPKARGRESGDFGRESGD
ncbi:hypothetical protein GCM10027345_25570 [Hymenobacter daeguensis]